MEAALGLRNIGAVLQVVTVQSDQQPLVGGAPFTPAAAFPHEIGFLRIEGIFDGRSGALVTPSAP